MSRRASQAQKLTEIDNVKQARIKVAGYGRAIRNLQTHESEVEISTEVAVLISAVRPSQSDETWIENAIEKPWATEMLEWATIFLSVLLGNHKGPRSS